MFATFIPYEPPVLPVLRWLRSFGAAAVPENRQARAAEEDEAELHRLPLRTLEDLGLLSDEGCATDWGLIERAARLRSGWA